MTQRNTTGGIYKQQGKIGKLQFCSDSDFYVYLLSGIFEQFKVHTFSYLFINPLTKPQIKTDEGIHFSVQG